MVAIRRGEGNSASSVRVIGALSRFDDVPETLVVELTDAGYVSHGSDTDVAVADAMAMILERVPSALPGLTVDELRDQVPRTTTQRAIERLIAEGRIERLGAGVRGDPFRFVAAQPGRLGVGIPPAPVPLDYGIFGDDEDWVMGTA